MTSRKKTLPITSVILTVLHSLCKFILETEQGYTAVLSTVICLDKSSCKAPANTHIKFRLECTFHLLITNIPSLCTKNKYSFKENKEAFK